MLELVQEFVQEIVQELVILRDRAECTMQNIGDLLFLLQTLVQFALKKTNGIFQVFNPKLFLRRKLLTCIHPLLEW